MFNFNVEKEKNKKYFLGISWCLSDNNYGYFMQPYIRFTNEYQVNTYNQYEPWILNNFIFSNPDVNDNGIDDRYDKYTPFDQAGTLTYQDKTYKTVIINGKEWMAENLAFLPSVSPSTDGSYTEPIYYVFDYQGNDVIVAKKNDNYSTYGVLYNWKAAKTACPVGWHLSTSDEWEQLAQFVSDQNGGYIKYNDDWEDVGKHLKTTSGWYENDNGTDDYGFAGMGGGFRSRQNDFGMTSQIGNWWSTTEVDSTRALSLNIGWGGQGLGRINSEKESGYSIRCIKD